MKNGGADAPPFFVSGPRAGMAKLADARDLKSCVRKDIRVRSPVPASLPAHSSLHAAPLSRRRAQRSSASGDQLAMAAGIPAVESSTGRANRPSPSIFARRQRPAPAAPQGDPRYRASPRVVHFVRSLLSSIHFLVDPVRSSSSASRDLPMVRPGLRDRRAAAVVFAIPAVPIEEHQMRAPMPLELFIHAEQQPHRRRGSTDPLRIEPSNPQPSLPRRHRGRSGPS